ncbi:MAG TPA: hypothetical protein VIW73_00445 [Candidatus Cybelea sp.]
MKTRRTRYVLALLTIAAMPLAGSAAPTPTPAPTAAPAETASEVRFVAQVAADLQARFSTTSMASAAGYFRYTPEDQTGAISWVNTKNWKSDPTHPSQLWYDVNGRLLGADFSVLQSDSPNRPAVWGVSAARWIDFSPGHVHFAIKTASGLQYGGVGTKTMTKVGGSVGNPTAADIFKISKLKRWKVLAIPAPASVNDIAFVFPFPAVWDLQVWLIPNPLGAFAEYNPDVKPSAAAKNQD